MICNALALFINAVSTPSERKDPTFIWSEDQCCNDNLDLKIAKITRWFAKWSTDSIQIYKDRTAP